MIDLEQACRGLVERLERSDKRVLLGVAGAPGAGKSTAATAILAAASSANIPSVVVGMDGWHLAHSVLLARGHVSIKGSPETFDAHGFVDAVQRVARQGKADASIWLPEFRRDIEDAVAGAIEVKPEHRLVLVEGNYVLLNQAPWNTLRELFDEAWILTPPEEIRRQRLIERHARHGNSPDEARSRALGSDERNAQLVLRESQMHDVICVNPG